MARLIVIREGVQGYGADRVDEARRIAPDFEVLAGATDAALEARAAQIVVAFDGLPESVRPRATALRWVQLSSAGAEHALAAYPTAGVRLTTASGVHAVPIMEHVLGLMLAFGRGLHRAALAQVAGRWKPQGPRGMRELRGSCLVVVGLGAIGREIARVAAALGMEVLGVRRHPGGERPEGVRRVVGQDSLAEVLPHADFVVMTVPHTRRTEGLLGTTELNRMKPTAYLINIGRGRTVREEDLILALRQGRLAGAGLDVFEEEPLPTGSPLWSMENVIITAHYSGVTPRYGERLWGIFLDNLRRYLAGEPLVNLVDRAEGY